jgi:hypothetical protein
MSVKLFYDVDASSLSFSKPVKIGSSYRIFPEAEAPIAGLTQSDYVTLDSPMSENGEMLSRVSVRVSPKLGEWVRAVEKAVVSFTKANKADIFHDADNITDAFVDAGFRPSVDASGTLLTMRLSKDVAVFSASKGTLDARDVRVGARGTMLLSFECIELGKKTFGVRWVFKAFRTVPETPYCFIDDDAKDVDSDDSDTDEKILDA